jgi:Ca2+-binding RTX toxin-like protein
MKKYLPKMSKYRKYIVISAAVIVFSSLFIIYKNQKARNVKAYGNLVVDYGQIAPEEPMFDFDDFKPGDCEDRIITITNASDSTSVVYVRSENTQTSGNLTDALYFSIYDTSFNYYYGENNSKTLADFFNDSSYPGIPLFTLGGGEFITITFTVCFEITAGNEYQETSTVFDIVFSEGGSPIDLPRECIHLLGVITEVVEGTEGDDDIHGSIANELILAYGGNDEIDASSGSDCVIAGSGDDEIDSESGNDVVIGGEGNDEIDTGSGDDIVYGGPGEDEIDTGTGNDIVYAGDDDDEVEAGANDDLVYGGLGNDEIDGESGNDEVYGEEGNDTIRGGSDNDFLYGGDGDDHMMGKSGEDFLDGGNGFDELDGGFDDDTCINGEVLDSCEI